MPITLDGDLGDWDRVPTVTMPDDADLTSDKPAVSFAGAADVRYLYFMTRIIDANIISGEHGAARTWP